MGLICFILPLVACHPVCKNNCRPVTFAWILSLNHLIFPDDRMFPIRPGSAMQQLTDAAIERLMAAYDRGECIVVFCTESCNSSDQVAHELRNSGLIQAPVYVLEGGWLALKRAGIAED